VAGKLTRRLLQPSLTTAPPAGAGPFRVTVAVRPFPPITAPAESERLTRLRTFTFNDAEMPAQPFRLAVIFAEMPLVPMPVETLKLADVCPAPMVTVASTWTSGLLLARLTTNPPAGAGAFRVTVPVSPDPPITTLADRVSPDTQITGLTVTEMEAPAQPFTLAVILARTLLRTVPVVMLKVAEICPAGMNTVAATCTSGRLLCRLTVKPPAGAAAVKVTVPVRPVPPVTALADRVTDCTHGGGVTVRVAEALELPSLPVRVTCTVVSVTLVVTGKFAELWPAGTVTEAPTWATELLLCNVTAIPPAGAAPLRVTVPVALLPPVT
jgi:hypothetical protein